MIGLNLCARSHIRVGALLRKTSQSRVANLLLITGICARTGLIEGVVFNYPGQASPCTVLATPELVMQEYQII